MENQSIRISPAGEGDIADLVREISTLEEVGPTVKVVSSKGFGGVAEVTLVISALGGPVVVKSLASILIAWMKRNEKRSVTIGKTKIVGYSTDEVERLLKVAKRK